MDPLKKEDSTYSRFYSFAVKNLTNCGTGGAKGRDLFCGSKEDQEVAKRIDLLLLMRSNTAVLNTGM